MVDRGQSHLIGERLSRVLVPIKCLCNDVKRHHAFSGCHGGALDALAEFQGVGEDVFKVGTERS